MAPTSDNHSTRVRRTAYFSGRVQGVGFRFTAEAIAAGFSVTGFVRNLADGRVELVAEGTPAELDRFQRSLEQSMRSNIREVTAADAPATGEFTGFSLAF